jgi:hypothetical protein
LGRSIALARIWRPALLLEARLQLRTCLKRSRCEVFRLTPGSFCLIPRSFLVVLTGPSSLYPATSLRRGISSTVRRSMALFIRQLPKGARSQGSACFNSKLSHFVNQRSTRQSQPIGRSILPTDQPVGLVHVSRICSRSASASVRGSLSELCFNVCFKSSGRRSTDPGEKSTARSMKFCSSRILPGQSCALRTAITPSGITSNGLVERGGKFCHQELRQRQDVLNAFAERRQAEWNDVQLARGLPETASCLRAARDPGLSPRLPAVPAARHQLSEQRRPTHKRSP